MSARTVRASSAFRYESKGRRVLLLALQASSAAELAKTCRMSRQAITSYATGARRPGIDHALDLRLLGIDPEDWRLEPFATHVADR